MRIISQGIHAEGEVHCKLIYLRVEKKIKQGWWHGVLVYRNLEC